MHNGFFRETNGTTVRQTIYPVGTSPISLFVAFNVAKMLVAIGALNAVGKQVIYMVLIAGAALFRQLLDVVKEFGSDDSLVAVRNIILRNLPVVFDFPKGQHSGGELLLHQAVADEFFIGQNITHSGAKPLLPAITRRNAQFV